jgi:hypothetical protein
MILLVVWSSQKGILFAAGAIGPGGRGHHGRGLLKQRWFTLDDVEYAITVYNFSDGFRAFCDCNFCPNHAMKTDAAETVDAAIEKCEALIRIHHDGIHARDIAG